MSKNLPMTTGTWHIDTDLPRDSAKKLIEILGRHGLHPIVRVVDKDTWHLTLHRGDDE